MIQLKPITELNKFNADVAIDEQLALLTTKPKGWLPVKSPELDMVALFDKNGKPIKIVNLRNNTFFEKMLPCNLPHFFLFL